MRRTTAWIVVLGVVVTGTATPVQAQDGFWVSIASGVAGATNPSSYQDFFFDTPHGPPPVALTSYSGPTAEATTGGGSAFFSAGALPVVVHPTDGFAYLTAGGKPDDLSQALKRQMAGGKGLATTTPDALTAVPPTDANLLSVNLADPDANGARALTVGLADPLGNALGGGSVLVPDGGWWVIGLGPNPSDNPPPVVIPDPPPPVVIPDPPPVVIPDPDPVTPGGGPVATPEPATALLAGIGAISAFGVRLVKRRREA